MNAPVIWIGLPGVAAISLWVIRKNERLTLFTALIASFLFMVSSWVLQVGKPLMKLGSFTIQISPSITILGRSFILNNGDLIFISLLFLILFLFLSMSFVIDVPPIFVPLSFILICLFISALSVQPFLYAALILEICVIISTILLSDPGKVPGLAVTRFLVFQTLAMPFMLSSGWVLSAAEANPTDTKLIFQALVLLGLGFSIWLGVFPFNTWMFQLAKEMNPFLVSFVLILFNTAITILIIRYLNGFIWLRDDARIFLVLRTLGIIMVLSSSVFFLFEKSMERTIAYIISYEAGLTLIAMSLNQMSGWTSLLLMFLPRILSVSIWAAVICYVQQIKTEEGDGQQVSPIAFISLGIAILTIGGVPLLPGYPSRLILLTNLAQIDMQSYIWTAISMMFLLIAGIRFLYMFAEKNIFGPRAGISKIEYGYFIAISSVIIITGLDPFSVFNKILTVLEAFPNIK